MNILTKVKNMSVKTKLISASVAVLVIVAVATCVAIFLNKTKEVSQIESIPGKVADVTEANIQFEYNNEPTEEAVALSIKEYDNNYNLYYYIQEVGQVTSEEQENEVNSDAEVIEPDAANYILYGGQPISIETNSIISFKYEKDGEYSENTYKLEITNIIDNGEATEGATEEELEEGKVDVNDKSNNVGTYYIKINYTANCVTIYQKDANGDYTVPVKAMVCSTGKATPTSGVYKTQNKYVWKILNGGVWGQYSTRIVGSILFHSVPYSSPNHDALKYNLYDKLGTKASAGCVRLTTADAKWIYDNCGLGTMVEFYSSSNPGPLGKPSAQKISDVVECRSWDPTDPAPGNPWRTWNGQTTTQTQPSAPAPQQQNSGISKPTTPPTNTNTNTNTDDNTNTNNNTDTNTDTDTNTNTNTNTESNTNTNTDTTGGDGTTTDD